MNQFNKSNMNDRAVEKLLEQTAQQTNPNPIFQDELERRLKQAHQPKNEAHFLSLKQLAPILGWAVLIILMVYGLSWAFKSFAPFQFPASNQDTPSIPILPSEAAPSGTTFDYVVKQGDTCGLLANKYGTTIEAIMAQNGLTDSCQIMIDQVLKIPFKTQNSTPQGKAYDWNGQTLYLNATLPDTPEQVRVYRARNEVRSTADDARALAEQLGMDGEIYEITGELPGTMDYLVVDGSQELHVRSDQYFTYYPDYALANFYVNFAKYPNAEKVAEEFMQSHGFDFAHKLEYTEMYEGYVAVPLTPDGFPLYHEHFKLDGLFFRFSKDGLVTVDAGIMKYDATATMNIISAQDALQKMLSPGLSYGVLGGMHSANPPIQTWRRVQPLDTTVTYYGWMNSTGKSITGAAPLITLDGYTITGNTGSINENMPNTYVEATGQFHVSNGIKSFALDSWKVYDGFEEGYIGTIQAEGDHVVINTAEGKKFILPEIPADLPLPSDNMFVLGISQGDVFQWKTIDDRALSGGGGGGGGSSGFYKINFTGTPVPIPMPAPLEATPPESNPVGQRIDGKRGILQLNIYQGSDGSQRTEYAFLPDDEGTYYLLEGSDLQNLDNNQNRPLIVWGTIDHINQSGMQVIKVERYELPFPDLQFQILRGTSAPVNVGGQSVSLFTAESGESYVMLYANGSVMDPKAGDINGQIIVEALIVPDEKIGTHSAMRIFSNAPAINPKSGEPMELSITADQPNTLPQMNEELPQPMLTIEKVELVYFAADQRYIPADQNTNPVYLQPVWRFSGHYSDGSEFEELIQALQDKFLLPEIQELPAPG